MFKIIHRWWQLASSTSLPMACNQTFSKFLNFHSDPNIQQNMKVINDLYSCIKKMLLDEIQNKEKVIIYKNTHISWKSSMEQRKRMTVDNYFGKCTFNWIVHYFIMIVEWWKCFGMEISNLQKITVRILSLAC